MKITVLCENTSYHGLPCEHGLSLFIETEHHKLLFDTGQSGLFAENAQKAGIDLSQVDICVLSHGHYDHGGALKIFSQINDKAKIYMNRYAFGFHYHGSERYNGLERSWLEDDELQAARANAHAMAVSAAQILFAFSFSECFIILFLPL